MSSTRSPKTIEELISSSLSSSESDESTDRPSLSNGLSTTEGLIEKYTAPALTFGLELEFDFCVLKEKHKEWTNEEKDPLKNPYLSASEVEILEKQIAAGESIEAKINTTNSDDHEISISLLQYLHCLLNYQLPGQENMVSVLGEVDLGTPKTLAADKWHLTYDDSLHPHRKGIEGTVIADPDERKIKYRVTGAELVSKVLKWEDEETWMNMLQQLDRDLSAENDESWGYFDQGGTEALHVHFGVLGDDQAFNSPLGLKVVKNLLALYGLFEDQIEKYVPHTQRNDEQWCPRLRLGMEKTKREKMPGTAEQYYATEKPKRYTPEEFTEGIYACNSLEELKTFVTGEPMAGKWQDGSERKARQQINYTTVNISLQRDNKPTTIEFRHQKGTLNPHVIKHWVRLCGTMLQTAYIYAKLDFEFGNGPEVEFWDGESFLSQFVSSLGGNAGEILDIINLPDDSKTFLADQKLKYAMTKGGASVNHIRLIQELEILMRRRRLLKDKERTGELMDGEIEVGLSGDENLCFLK